MSSLEFLPDLAAALREAYRVLKPDGRLVVSIIGLFQNRHTKTVLLQENVKMMRRLTRRLQELRYMRLQCLDQLK